MLSGLVMSTFTGLVILSAYEYNGFFIMKNKTKKNQTPPPQNKHALKYNVFKIEVTADDASIKSLSTALSLSMLLQRDGSCLSSISL